MLSASDLTQEQIETIKMWVSEGAQMADVQKRLMEDFQLNVTYMDTRFIALDLELEFFQEVEVEEPVEEEIPEEVAPATPSLEVLAPDPGAPSVTVGIDQVAYPGSMISGSVTFSDGEKGLWMIDVEGRPSIDPETDDYRPSQVDLEDFQAKLRAILGNHV